MPLLPGKQISTFQHHVIHGYSKWLSGFEQLVIHNTLEIGVYLFFYFFLCGYVNDQVYVPPLPAISRNWRHESEPPLKPSPLTCYRQYGTNSIIMLMFVQGDSLARGPKLLSIKSYVIEIMTWKFIYTYWQRWKTAWTTTPTPPAIYWTRPVTCICLSSALDNSLGPLARESPCRITKGAHIEHL